MLRYINLLNGSWQSRMLERRAGRGGVFKNFSRKREFFPDLALITILNRKQARFSKKQSETTRERMRSEPNVKSQYRQAGYAAGFFDITFCAGNKIRQVMIFSGFKQWDDSRTSKNRHPVLFFSQNRNRFLNRNSERIPRGLPRG